MVLLACCFAVIDLSAFCYLIDWICFCFYVLICLIVYFVDEFSICCRWLNLCFDLIDCLFYCVADFCCFAFMLAFVASYLFSRYVLLCYLLV